MAFGDNPWKKTTAAPAPKAKQPDVGWKAFLGGSNWSLARRVADANPGTNNRAATAMAMYLKGQKPVQPSPVQMPQGPGGGSGGGGGGYGRGGGGGGAAVVDTHPQAQMDYLTSVLGGQSYKAEPMTAQRDALNNLRSTVTTASQQDQAAATGAYNGLDSYLQQNNRNPYADVKLNRANVAPSYNPYLESQGVQGLNPVTENPDDSYGAFQNVLSLLGANQQAGQQSRLAESQMARTFSGQQIGAMDNAYLANITGRESDIATQEQARQTALDAEKRAAMLQLAALIGQGAKPPDLAALGLGGAAPAAPAPDPNGWAAAYAAYHPNG